MSHLLARIMLAILLFPLAVLVYAITLMICMQLGLDRLFGYGWWGWVFILVGLVTWGFVGFYWWGLWRRAVSWTTHRVRWTWAAVLGAALPTLILGGIIESFESGLGMFTGSATAPLVWVVLTVLLWRETPAERAQRIRLAGRENIVCPTCGYNLTGLKQCRCPECGSEFTLDELLAGQPGRAMDQIER